MAKPAGRQPVLLLSRDDAYDLLNKFVTVGKAEGIPKPCVVNCDNRRTISKVHLVEKISRIPPRRIPEVKRALGYALAWEERIDTPA